MRIARPDGSPLLLVGLTGGIATGKSTVSGMFREQGAVIVDADAIVHELLGPGGLAVGPAIAVFGDGVRDAAGGVDRARLAEVVFRDEGARRKLEAVVHPLVIATSEARMTEAGGRAELVIYDAALLVETGRFAEFDRLIVVVTSADVQMRRLMDRDGLSAQQAGARIRMQAPLSRKAELADYVIDNSGHWGETRREVSEVWRLLQEDARLLRAGRPLPRRRVAP